MAANETLPAQGDLDNTLLRKILLKLKRHDDGNDPRPADSKNNLLRKILNRFTLLK